MKSIKRVLLMIFLSLLSVAMVAQKQKNKQKKGGSVPIVQATSTFHVKVDKDITYADGLSHQNLKSDHYDTVPLKLDVYSPDTHLKNRPAFIFIHGGGFFGGDKQKGIIPKFANYYASRGWVFISINYRLANDYGNVPKKWADYSMNHPDSSAHQRHQFLATYPAVRDSKAAIRWVVAHAKTYNINTKYFTVGGGSAGSITAIAVGISNPKEFTNEIEPGQDPTLAGTNLGKTYKVATIIDFWGSKVLLDLYQKIYGQNANYNNAPPLFIAHGTRDPKVPFSKAEELKAIYEVNKRPFAFYPLKGYGHGAWNATVDNKSLEKLAFDFIVEQQKLIVK